MITLYADLQMIADANCLDRQVVPQGSIWRATIRRSNPRADNRRRRLRFAKEFPGT